LVAQRPIAPDRIMGHDGFLDIHVAFGTLSPFYMSKKL
jgi:hypothetical protein